MAGRLAGAVAVAVISASVAATAVSATPLTSSRSRVSGRACSWKTVSVTKAGGFAQLHALAGTAGSDIWAVGNQDANGKPLVLHFDGSHWSTVAAPGKGNLSDLWDVDAISKTNAWAVGYYTDSQGHAKTLTEHWDGHVWKIVTSPNIGPSSNSNTLHGVSAVNGSNIWAVGITGPEPGEGMLIEHWNGTKWLLSTPGSIGMPGALDDVEAISAGNVVAVGHRAITAAATLVERFDGGSWSAEVSADPPGAAGSELWGVSAPSAGAQWAVGDLTTTQAHLRTLAERSTGGAWSLKPPANVGADPNELLAVSALSATKAFAVGSRKSSSQVRRTLAESFVNGSWHVQTTPNAGSEHNVLEAVHAVSATNVWAAGTANTLVGSNPLMLHYSC